MTSDLRDLAWRLLAHEVHGRREGDAWVDAADGACQRLRDHLGRLIGPTGVLALLGRAIALERTESPFLNTVRVEANGRLSGLREAIQEEEDSRVSAGLAAVLANFLWLLVTFIGEDLTLRLASQVWPDVPLHASGPGSEEDTP
jgi:hypothetical protein